MSDISKNKLERARERLEKSKQRIYRNLKDVTTTNPNSQQQQQQQSQSEKHQKRFSTSTPFHSFSTSLSLPTFRGSLLSPPRFSKEFDSARANCRRDRDFQIRIEGICRVLVTSLERNTIFRRDWEGFGSFLHLELERGSRLRFLGFFFSRVLFKGECAGGLRSYRWEAFFVSRKMVCCFDYAPYSCIFFKLIAFCFQCVGKIGFLPFNCNARWNLIPLRKLRH